MHYVHFTFLKGDHQKHKHFVHSKFHASTTLMNKQIVSIVITMIKCFSHITQQNLNLQ